MSLPPTYSRRKREAEKTGEDVYVYDHIPQKVRVQVVQILGDGLGRYYHLSHHTPISPVYDALNKHMCRELGVYSLSSVEGNKEHAFFSWLQKEENVEYWLDGLEQALIWIDGFIRKNWSRFQHWINSTPDETISELNARLREAGLGYEFSGGTLIRKDSEIIHRDVVIPVLHLLKAPKFAAADKEFREAHEAFRHGRLEECIAKCGNALESVLKVIGHARKWTIKDTDTAKALIQAGIKDGFLAPYLDATLTHLRCLIESSTPTLRNKEGGHGAGLTPRVVPPHLASFQLHQTAAVILFLAEQDAALLP
jgi:hypothetical protein